MNFGPQNFTIFNGFWQYFPNLKLNFSRTKIHNDLKLSGYIHSYNIYLQHYGFFKTHFCFKVIAWNPLKNCHFCCFLRFLALQMQILNDWLVRSTWNFQSMFRLPEALTETPVFQKFYFDLKLWSKNPKSEEFSKILLFWSVKYTFWYMTSWKFVCS